MRIWFFLMNGQRLFCFNGEIWALWPMSLFRIIDINNRINSWTTQNLNEISTDYVVYLHEWLVITDKLYICFNLKSLKNWIWKNAHSQSTYTQSSSFLGILAKQSKEEDIILVESAIKLQTGITTIKPPSYLECLDFLFQNILPINCQNTQIWEQIHVHSGVCSLYFPLS